MGMHVFGINHADPASHQTFRTLCRLPFDLLSDEGKKVSAAYGAVRNLFGATIIQRTVVGIGQDGVIHFLKQGMPKGSDILKALRPHLVRPTEKVV
jgi:peroxiredoxin